MSGGAGHVILSGRDGALDGTPEGEVAAILQRLRGARRVVIHFHGGLVNEATGRAIADRLADEYRAAGAEPVFVVWRSGLLEILRSNLGEIARDPLFNSLLRRILQFTVGKLWQTEGQRGLGLTVPNDRAVDAELRRRDDDAEPYSELNGPSGVTAPTNAERDRFEEALNSDDDLRVAFSKILAQRHPETSEVSRGITVRREASAASLIDPDVLDEITPHATMPGQRGLISTLYLAKKAFDVFVAVIGRFRSGMDHGLYPTVVEELLRTFYLANAGGAVWAAMKQETADAFAAPDRVGRRILDGLVAGPGPRPQITLVGHSTGGVYIDHLLHEVARGIADGDRPWPQEAKFRVALLAPANTYPAFGATHLQHDRLIAQLRMFTMTDAAECQDRLVGAIYPRSLLFLVSGALERDRTARSVVVPVTGLSRYLDVRAPGMTDWPGPQTYLRDRAVLSPTGDAASLGFRADSLKHGDFDDTPLVLQSLRAFVELST